MGQTIKITCDSCAKDLTYTTNCDDFYISLSNERMRSRGGIVMLMGKYPALDRDLTFCGLACLDRWTARRQFRDALHAQWNEKWNAEHTTNYSNGLKSYAVPPDDVELARDAEIDRQVTAKFPDVRAESA